MGKVFSSESVRSGNIPAPDGTSQLDTALAIRSQLREADRSISHFVICGQGYGSTITGNAGRRGDVDFIIGVGYSPDKQAKRRAGSPETIQRPVTDELIVQQQLLFDSLKKKCARIALRYSTQPEVQYFSLADARDSVANIAEDPLYLDHLVKSPVVFRVGDPFRDLRESAIDVTTPLTPEEQDMVTIKVLQYMTNRARFFLAAANEFPEVTTKIWKLRERIICAALQRALESAKASARKMMAVGVVQGVSAAGADVTSKSSMYQQFERVADQIGHSGLVMLDTHRQLIERDREYDEVLEAAIISGTTHEYERWIRSTLFDTLMKAYKLTAICHEAVDNLAYSNGVVIDDFYNDERYRLVKPGDSVDFSSDSSSAPLLDAHQLPHEPQTSDRENLVHALM